VICCPVLSLEHLAKLAENYRGDLDADVREFKIGSQHFAFNSLPHFMGVVNLSPDSWYRESVCLTTKSAVERGQLLIKQGAHLVDLGGESTMLDAERVDAKDQSARLVPVIKELAQAGSVVSAEPYESSVARACLESGAAVINLTGPEESGEIYRLAAAHDAAVIICFVQGDHVRAVDDRDLPEDPIPILADYFEREIQRAMDAGLMKILIDPGLGFYYQNLRDSQTRVRHQMEVFLTTFRLRKLGWPICHALPHAPEIFQEEVRSAEPFFAVLAALGKTSLFRTHEVPRTKAVLETLGTY
jgi:dihydropteroate synthase